MSCRDLLAAARGDSPADLVLTNGRVVNVFTGEIERADIAICGDKIAGVGSNYQGRERIDLQGSYIAPGLIDAHVHIESSLCLPAQFALAVVPRGVTTVIADPHEIANVAGAAGVRFMAEASRDLPLRVILMAPSCVPATDLATAGASLDAEQLAHLLNDKIVHGLAEVMNYPSVIHGDSAVLSKLAAFRGRPIDGHAPGVAGKLLNAYIAAGIGSDHECVTVDEARAKLARGLYILIREATNAHNLDALLPLITPNNSRRICFCTDDRQPADLLNEGSVDHMIRRAIAFGIDPVMVFQMATLNTAEWFGLHDRGAIAPGRLADLMIFDDLKAPIARTVYTGGKVYKRAPARKAEVPTELTTTVNINWNEVDFPVTARNGRIRVIEALPDQLITRSLIVEPREEAGRVVTDTSRDILKIAVIERHRATGRMGIGFIKGFGLKSGAIAGTVAHDHHNLVVIGVDDRSMMAAAQSLQASNGGYSVAEDGRTLMTMMLPIAGLMIDDGVDFVAREYDGLLKAARLLGSTMHDPFMAMSFMALEVIPALKLTDRGLVDVESFSHVDLFVE